MCMNIQPINYEPSKSVKTDMEVAFEKINEIIDWINSIKDQLL